MAKGTIHLIIRMHIRHWCCGQELQDLGHWSSMLDLQTNDTSIWRMCSHIVFRLCNKSTQIDFKKHLKHCFYWEPVRYFSFSLLNISQEVVFNFVSSKCQSSPTARILMFLWMLLIVKRGIETRVTSHHFH